MPQYRVVRFIARLREWESVTEACAELGLQPLKQRRRNHRLSLLIKILQDEEWHSTLSVAYDEITGDRQKVTMTTRSTARGEITSVYAASHVYHSSFIQEPLEISEEILINKKNIEIVWKQKILTNTTNQQQIAVTPVTHKNCTLLAKWGTPLCNYAHECSKSLKVSKVFNTFWVMKENMPIFVVLKHKIE